MVSSHKKIMGRDMNLPECDMMVLNTGALSDRFASPKRLCDTQCALLIDIRVSLLIAFSKHNVLHTFLSMSQQK